jgi:hypothetical protein
MDVMMDTEEFRALAAEIQSLGYDEETAANYASLIGDTPIFDDDGRVVVQSEDGAELARLKLKFFGE